MRSRARFSPDQLLEVRFSHSAHPGRVRALNEDTALCLPDHKIWLVADGMSGVDGMGEPGGGDFASQTVADCVARVPPDLAPADKLRAVEQAILHAHEIIREESYDRGGDAIATTVVAFIIAQDRFATLWAGDSRLYRYQPGHHGIKLLTTDHSYVARFVSAGQMSWDEAQMHPQSRQITRAVGAGGRLELDKIHGTIQSRDRFLLCTDGLTKYATFATLSHVLSRAPIETVATDLQQIALDGGGDDNIAIIVIDAP